MQTVFVDLSKDSMSIDASVTIGQFQLLHGRASLFEHYHLAEASSRQTTWYLVPMIGICMCTIININRLRRVYLLRTAIHCDMRRCISMYVWLTRRWIL